MTIEKASIHPVDQRLPIGRSLLLGFQHVLVMYTASIVVPLILGTALKLSHEHLMIIISAGLFVAGLSSLIQSWGFMGFGMRMPVMMGVTFTAVTPMIVIASNPELGLNGVYGAILVSGLFGIACAPFIGRFLHLFPAVVTGSVLIVIGISLMRVSIEWAAGGSPLLESGLPNPDYGKPLYLAISAGVFALILIITRFARGFLANIAVLIGVLSGFAVAFTFGQIDLHSLADARWFTVIPPFAFGPPVFELSSIISMCLVMLVTLVESTGMFLALGMIVKRPITPVQLSKGLRADGLGAVLGGIFSAFPYTSFSQNIGLVTLTGVKSRYVCATGGIILILMGLFPKLAVIIAATPPYVLGAAALVMFGMVTMMGIRILSTINFEQLPNNTLIAAVSIGIGMIPLLSPSFFNQLPSWTHVITDSGIVLTTLSALLLNLAFNGWQAPCHTGPDTPAANLATDA